MEILPRDIQVGWLGLSQRNHDHNHYNNLQLQQLKHRYDNTVHVYFLPPSLYGKQIFLLKCWQNLSVQLCSRLFFLGVFYLFMTIHNFERLVNLYCVCVMLVYYINISVAIGCLLYVLKYFQNVSFKVTISKQLLSVCLDLELTPDFWIALTGNLVVTENCTAG